MAIKSSNKPRKTTSLKKGATHSTVTPIGLAAHSGGTQSHALQPMDREVEQQVRVRAYELFEERGRHEGYDRDDWARAEVEVRAQFQRAKSA